MENKAQLDENEQQQQHEEQVQELPNLIETTVVVSCKKFDFNLVCSSFLQSIDDKDAINICFYLRGFTELNKFFNMFGTLFTFVSKDVQEKIGILNTYSTDKEQGANYQTIQSMFEYEKSQNLLAHLKRPSGARTLLRLHRALEFISQFLYDVAKVVDNESTSGLARDAYNRTLAKHHPWIIRKSVHLATIALPYRRVIIERVYGGSDNVPEQKVVNENMVQMAGISDRVFELTHKLYEKHELLDLP